MRALPVLGAATPLLCLLGSGCGSVAGSPEEAIGSSAEAVSQCSSGTLPEGIDISDGQGKVDWATAAKSSAIAWTMMKATQGTYNVQTDFAANWAAAKAAGVARGAYHFFDPTEDGAAQAAAFLKVVGPLDAEDLSPTVDIECPISGDATCLGFSGGSGAASAAEIRTRLLDFQNAVESATGRKPLIYTFGSYFTGNAIDTSGFDAYPLWIANLSPTAAGCITLPAPWSVAALWQYSFTGTVSGVSGQVDRDRALESLDELRGWPSPRGASVADIDGDGRADACGRDAAGVTCALATASGFGTPFAGPAWSDAAGWRPSAYASTVQFADIDGDGKGDVCGRAPAGITCARGAGSAFGTPFAGPAWSDAAGWNSPVYYATIQFGDLDGDGKADICGRAALGMQCAISTGTGFAKAFGGPAWSDAAGWNAADRYRTIRLADIDGDGKADLCGRGADGLECALSTGSGFGTPFTGPAWSDAAGWAAAAYASTIQFPDIDGDGKADACARGPLGILCARSTGTGFAASFAGPAWSDAAGWNVPSRYATVVFLDLDGDGKDDVCGRDGDGIHCALSTGKGFGAPFAGPAWTDAAGWNQPHYFGTIRGGDVNGDGLADLCARSATSLVCSLSSGTSLAPTTPGPAWSDAAWGVAPYWSTVAVVGRTRYAGIPPVTDGGVPVQGEDGGSPVGTTGGSDAGMEPILPLASSPSGCHCNAAGDPFGQDDRLCWTGVALVAALAARRRTRKTDEEISC